MYKVKEKKLKLFLKYGQVLELVYILVLETKAEGIRGSIPLLSTNWVSMDFES